MKETDIPTPQGVCVLIEYQDASKEVFVPYPLTVDVLKDWTVVQSCKLVFLAEGMKGLYYTVEV